jgi:molecular chaperone GrpE
MEVKPKYNEDDVQTPRQSARADEPRGAAPTSDADIEAAAATGTESDPLAELQRQVDERQQAYVRVLADFQNFQRRARENESRAREIGISFVARAIVPVLENMDLALGHDLRSLPADKLADGVTLLRTELLKALAQCGVDRIDPAAGDEFNPMLHEAVLEQPTNAVPAGRIARCMQAGYRLGDVPLRPAKVAVARASN